jgi:hypothetical protein
MAVEHILRKMSNMTDKNEKTERKIQILNHRDGTYTFQAFENGELVEEKKGHRPERNYDIPNPEDITEQQMDTYSRLKRVLHKDMTKEEIAKQEFAKGWDAAEMEADYETETFLQSLELLISGYRNKLADRHLPE